MTGQSQRDFFIGGNVEKFWVVSEQDGRSVERHAGQRAVEVLIHLREKSVVQIAAPAGFHDRRSRRVIDAEHVESGRDVRRAVNQGVDFGFSEQLFNVFDAAKMFVVAVAVVDAVAEFAGETVDEADGFIVQGNVVENVAGDNENVRLSGGDSFEQTFKAFERKISAEVHVGNLRDSEAVEFRRQIFYRYVEVSVDDFHAFDTVAIERNCQRHNRSEKSPAQSSSPRRTERGRLVEFSVNRAEEHG